MKGLLDRSVDYNAGETATGYLCRVAAWNGVDARRFARDMNVPFSAVASGNEAALNRLAELFGSPLDPIRASTFRQIENRWWWAGERILSSMLRRTEVRVCPLCLLEDVRGCDLPASRAWQRAAWCLAPVLTCPRHGIELVQVGRATERSQLHDFAALVRSVIPRLDGLAHSARRRGPSALQDYVLSRVQGRREMPWMDAMPLYAVIELCGLLGRVALFGRGSRSGVGLAVGDRHAADDAGFVIMEGGEEGLVRLLEHLVDTCERPRINNDRHSSVLFPVYVALDTVDDPTAYEAARTVVGRFVVERFPLPPGEYLGVVLRHRRFHTVAGLAQRIGSTERYLRSLLAGHGVIQAEEADRACVSVLLDEGEHGNLMRDLSARLDVSRAAARLGLTNKRFLVWVRSGLIRPFVEAPKCRSLFLASELDDFVERVARDAAPHDRAPPGHVGLFEAGRICGCRVEAILSAILSGDDLGLVRQRGVEGLRALHVDPERVQRRLGRTVEEGLTLVGVCERWRVSRDVARCLRDGEVLVPLTSEPGSDPAAPIRYDTGRVDDFLRTHAVLTTLAWESGKRADALRMELEAAGVRPVSDPALCGVAMYGRADVQAVVAARGGDGPQVRGRARPPASRHEAPGDASSACATVPAGDRVGEARPTGGRA